MRILAIAAMLAASTISAQAAITWTGWQTASIDLQNPNGGLNGLLFNQYTGTEQLKYLQFDMRAWARGQYTITNDDAEDGNVIFNATITVNVTDPLNNILVSVIPGFNVNAPLPVGSTISSAGYPGSYPEYGEVDPAPTAPIVLNGAQIALFTGNGQITLSTSGTTGSAVAADVDYVDQASSLLYGAEIKFQYGYDTPETPQIPEPASMALMGSALAGLGLLARRRMQK